MKNTFFEKIKIKPWIIGALLVVGLVAAALIINNIMMARAVTCKCVNLGGQLSWKSRPSSPANDNACIQKAIAEQRTCTPGADSFPL